MNGEKQNHTYICEHLFTLQTMLGVQILRTPAKNNDNNGKHLLK